MIVVDPKEIPVPKMTAYLQGAVAPRPIAFASTIDAKGNVNLSPFSFFNVFSLNPPILIFSPSRKVRDNSTKHTLQNVLEVPEVVINMVSYSMVEQMSLASCEFPKGVNEFVKSGFTQIPSARIKPPRVGESPASFECKVKQVIPLGDQGGAGNLVVCEILLAHFKEEIFDEQGRVDPQKLDAVARMGGDYYCRAYGSSVFTVPKPNEKVGVGLDQFPEHVRQSKVLTGNELGRLGNIEKLPDMEEVKQFQRGEEWRNASSKGAEELHRLASQFLQSGKVAEAWKVLL